MFWIIATSIDDAARRSDLETRTRGQITADTPGVPDEVAQALARNRANWWHRIAVLDNTARMSWFACAAVLAASILILI
ncbi:hypothetical protein [Chelatococcus reniformis]|uniref:Uncharacterized protein n=1 Tax=Chelatococcus reniformis TaxID=1494448 RepID=A0A916U8J4_9HYPH|nr:hypothetical protein [Chelatococcus reniformis]GGC64581.1 hypothetical protein GCM10010994_23970 [Chelatococcus reniformis]